MYNIGIFIKYIIFITDRWSRPLIAILHMTCVFRYSKIKKIGLYEKQVYLPIIVTWVVHTALIK